MYELFSAHYDELMNLDYDGYYKELSRLVDLKQKDILEVGCGTARMTERILKSARSLSAVDVSEDMLAIARSRLSDPRLQFYLLEDRLPFSQRFDVVLACIDVYHYLSDKDLQDHLQDVSSHLVEGGLLLFDLREDLRGLSDDISYDLGEDMDFFWFNEWDEMTQSLQMDFHFYVREGDHFRRDIESQRLYHHSRERLDQLLKQAGLSIEDSISFEGRQIIKAIK